MFEPETGSEEVEERYIYKPFTLTANNVIQTMFPCAISDSDTCPLKIEILT